MNNFRINSRIKLRIKSTLLGSLTTLLLTVYLPSQSIASASTDPEQKGLAIAQEVESRDTGWHDAKAYMQMILTNAEGEQSIREIRQRLLEVDGDGDKGLTIFDAPRDIKGTGFLSYTHAIDADEQWLFLPALTRVKRIASNNKSGPFIGSQFSYEDISSFEVAKFSYTYLRDEDVDGRPAFVIENKPNYKYSGYTRLITWIDQERYVPVKIAYYDRKNKLFKTQTFNDYKQYLNQYWRSHSQQMKNHINGKETQLEWKNYTFNTGLALKDFNRTVLKRLK